MGWRCVPAELYYHDNDGDHLLDHDHEHDFDDHDDHQLHHLDDHHEHHDQYHDERHRAKRCSVNIRNCVVVAVSDHACELQCRRGQQPPPRGRRGGEQQLRG